MFDFTELLIAVIADLPVMLTLIVGVVISYRQRKLRPRFARMFGGTLVAELIWVALGSRAYFYLMRSFGLYQSYSPSDVQNPGRILQSIQADLPASAVHAVIWGCALWTVLMVDDNPSTEKGICGRIAPIDDSILHTDGEKGVQVDG